MLMHTILVIHIFTHANFYLGKLDEIFTYTLLSFDYTPSAIYLITIDMTEDGNTIENRYKILSVLDF